ncbi:MAG TPA: ATP-binding protein [Candidatus Sulfotelmatobacter sp.]|nr:ATP-binding protein [Candidatus Sulfotelmatobacter sp.]
MENTKKTSKTASSKDDAMPAKGLNLPADEGADAHDTLAYEQRMRPLWATFRNILLVVLLIFICAMVQMFILWRVCDTGMKTAASLDHQGLPTLNSLALLQEDLAIYRLNAYESLFAQQGEKAAKAKAVQDIAAQTHAELEHLKTLLPEGDGRRLASNLEGAFADLDTESRKVRNLEDSDFAAAMKAMDQDIPPLTGRVDLAADAFSDYGYHFSGAQANATFDSFGWIKKNAIIFGTANIAVAFGAVIFVRLAARRSRTQLSHAMARLNERTGELAYERDLLRSLLDYSPDPIYFKDAESRFLIAGKVQAELFGLKSADELKGKSDSDFFAEEYARPAFADEQEIIRTGNALIGKVEREIMKNGRESWALTSKMPLRDKSGRIIGTFGISKDITVIKKTEARLEQMHKQLLETSRQAGMAEIATNVLHNVGNVLNSVNVSASLVVDSVKKSKAASLAKVVAMFQEHERDLGAFITSDTKGKQLPAYLAQLSEHLLADQKTTVNELTLLLKNIEHIKEIVTMQQTYARVSGVKEVINLRELVEDGLRMNLGALNRHGVEVVREFEDVPPMNVEKHKILQILVNLIRNAKYACQESARPDKRLTVRVANADGRIKVSVADNGVGISPENFLRIFNHGFTTRKDGHGFGLHSGALAAKEMGGSLGVASDGAGRGATFTLELPCPTEEKGN